MPKRAAQSDEKCRTPKVVRNKDDLSERKISRSKLNRKKRGRQKMSSSFFRRVFVTVARSFLAWYNDRQARSITTASTDKKSRQQNAVGYFLCRLAHMRAARSFVTGNAMRIFCAHTSSSPSLRPQRVLSCGDATCLSGKSLAQN